MNVFVKAVLGGFACSSGTLALLYAIGLTGALLAKDRSGSDTAIGWDPISALTLPGFIIGLVGMFALGFYLIFRRH